MKERRVLGAAGGVAPEVSDSSGTGNDQREIGPEGVDSKGNLCYWTGFDKGDGTFWGKPRTEIENKK